MRIIRVGLPAILALALVVAVVGWYRAEREHLSAQRFESCKRDGESLTLTYVYGANQVVAPSADSRGSDLVVSLNVRRGEGATPAIGLFGEATFALFGQPETIRYPDGTELKCES